MTDAQERTIYGFINNAADRSETNWALEVLNSLDPTDGEAAAMIRRLKSEAETGIGPDYGLSAEDCRDYEYERLAAAPA